MAVAHQLPQVRLDIQERGRQPAVALAGVLPVSTFAQRSSTSALTDSRQFVVFSDRPSTPYSPSRCSVRVSSRPSVKLPAADWFRSSSSPWSVSRA